MICKLLTECTNVRLIMLPHRLLTAVQAEPGIGIARLRQLFPNAKLRDMHDALSQLEGKGLVEMHKPGKYRCLPQALKPPEPIRPANLSRGSFIEPPSKARLMAGR